MSYQYLDDDPEKVIDDLSTRKEFNINIKSHTDTICETEGLKFHGDQMFVNALMSIDTPYMRLLMNWQTGVGKSIGAVMPAMLFVNEFRKLAVAKKDDIPSVYVISFTNTIREEMTNHPEFGFITKEELKEKKRKKELALAAGLNSDEARAYGIFQAQITRKITDHNRGGFFRFFGYREFENSLFTLTRKGIETNFDIQSTYNRQSGDHEIDKAIKDELLTVNEQILDELRHGFLICDEIHNVYNILEKNNYGIAIQYVLDTLGKDGPKTLLLSATPMKGSAMEIVDVLNLLVPKYELPEGKPLKKSDLFEPVKIFTPTEDQEENEESEMSVSKLLPDSLERITKLAAGRVSFLLDSDVESYPQRIFIGETIEDIPYLKLTICKLSDFHKSTIESSTKNASALSSNSYALYDIAFPNPKSETEGLYISTEVTQVINNAPQEWKTQVGIDIIKDGQIQYPTGNFLLRENIEKYSSKYAKLFDMIIEAMKSGLGKIMIYQHRVKTSGVLIIQEMLKVNGFLDEDGIVTEQTRCTICTKTNKEHKKSTGHDFIPARFVIIHSSIEKQTVRDRSRARFDSLTNIDGRQFRILIGSQIIKESYNFKAVRWMFVCSLPTDYPSMIQVFGRVVRKDSHSDLPLEDRNVKIAVIASENEIPRYINKGKEFIVIQEVERAMRNYAVNTFISYEKIKRALPDQSTLESLSLKLYMPHEDKTSLIVSTFEAYGWGTKEVKLIKQIVSALLKEQNVWTYDDLLIAVKSGKVKTSEYDVLRIDQRNFDIALKQLSTAIEGQPRLFNVPPFLIYALTLDYESYVRERPEPPTIIDLHKFIHEEKKSDLLSMKIVDFNEKYKSGDIPLEFSLVGEDEDVHYEILKGIIEEKNIEIPEGLIDIYRRFKILLRSEDVSESFVKRMKLKTSATDKISKHPYIGYVTKTNIAVKLNDGSWSILPNETIQRKENDYVIGFISDRENKLKIRPPVQLLKRKDMRKIERGTVCETKNRDDLIHIVNVLQGLAKSAGVKIDEKSVSGLCNIIRILLLLLEEKARNTKNGLRWVYIFNDIVPSVSSLKE